MTWADEVRKLKIRTNADKPDQAEQAIAFGAEGIGLCRTEHMFFDHIEEMREMILADTPEDRKKALAKLLPFQRADFEGIFRAMKGFPVTIRTLDPPLHEFLPHDDKGQAGDGQGDGRVDGGDRRARQGAARVQPDARLPRLPARHRLSRRSPRCRPGPSSRRPATSQKEGIKVEPEIMIPLVGFLTELKAQAKIVHDTAEKVFAEKGIKVPYLVGTMIELPRACIVADQIAKEARVLQLRHQRPDADRPRHEPRRLRQLHPPLHGERPGAEGSVPDDRLRRRRRPDEDRRREGPQRRGPT